MNYGQHGRSLLLELKRSEPDAGGDAAAAATAGGCSLPPYNDLLVGRALQDLRLHCQELQDQVEASTAATDGSGGDRKPGLHVRPSLLLQNAAIQRNKRCLLAYHVLRLRRIQEDLYWKQLQSPAATAVRPAAEDGAGGGSTGDDSSGNPYPNLCPAEQEFLARYADLVRRYTARTCGGGGDVVADLRAHTSLPPQPSDRTQIRVLAERGPVVLPSGASAVLSQGSTHFLLYADVEELIRDGSVMVLNGEEDE